MRSPDDPDCEFSLELSHEELESLGWLLTSLKILQQDPESGICQKAALAEAALEKMRDKLHDMHAVAHGLEEKVTEQACELSENILLNHLAKRSSAEGPN